MWPGWEIIETAPKDGTPVEVCQIQPDGRILFMRKAVWRTVIFPPPFDGGTAWPAREETGWMHTDMDKRVPGPTHWRPL